MPFTPFHMGPGILFKALLQGSFSLMVFGWAQIIIDIQPLIVLITGKGHLHGFTHTYIGAILLTVISAVTGKYLSEIGLLILGISKQDNPIKISWSVVFLSAFIGTFSHVLLDNIMHHDIEPFYPLYSSNGLFGILSVTGVHMLCFYSGVIGAIIYFFIRHREQIHVGKK